MHTFFFGGGGLIASVPPEICRFGSFSSRLYLFFFNVPLFSIFLFSYHPLSMYSSPHFCSSSRSVPSLPPTLLLSPRHSPPVYNVGEEREGSSETQVHPVPNDVGHSRQQQHPAHVEETCHHGHKAAVTRPNQLQCCEETCWIMNY